jgi:hypothetical protein
MTDKANRNRDLRTGRRGALKTLGVIGFSAVGTSLPVGTARGSGVVNPCDTADPQCGGGGGSLRTQTTEIEDPWGYTITHVSSLEHIDSIESSASVSHKFEIAGYGSIRDGNDLAYEITNHSVSAEGLSGGGVNNEGLLTAARHGNEGEEVEPSGGTELSDALIFGGALETIAGLAGAKGVATALGTSTITQALYRAGEFFFIDETPSSEEAGWTLGLNEQSDVVHQGEFLLSHSKAADPLYRLRSNCSLATNRWEVRGTYYPIVSTNVQSERITSDELSPSRRKALDLEANEDEVLRYKEYPLTIEEM